MAAYDIKFPQQPQYPLGTEPVKVNETPAPAPTPPPGEVIPSAETVPAAPSVQPASPSNEVFGTPPPLPAKRGFPKIILLILVLLLLVAGGAGLFKLISSKIKPSAGSNEITWWGLWEDDNIVKPLISEFESSHNGVKINYVHQSKEDYRERLVNSLAKGTGPDIFRFHNTWVPMLRPDLDPIPAAVMSPSDFNQTFYPVAANDLTAGTGILGIPLEYDGLALFINEDIFERGAKTPPTTWDQLRQTALDLTIKDEQGNIIQSGVALGRTENVDHWPEILALMMIQNGAKMSDPKGKLAEDALTFYSLFSSVDKVWDVSLPSSTQAFAAGKVAMYFGPSWRIHEIKAQNSKLKFRVIPVPQIPGTDLSKSNITYASYWVEGVWSRSKNKSLAWEFLKFLSTKDSLVKLYQNEAKTRLFGEPYPRIDMADLLAKDPNLAAFISQAPSAKSWYLASRTFDGPTGINTQLSKYFEDAVNAVVKRSPAAGISATLAAGVSQVLSRYGLTSPASVK